MNAKKTDGEVAKVVGRFAAKFAVVLVGLAVLGAAAIAGYDSTWIMVGAGVAMFVAVYGWKLIRGAARGAILSEATLVSEGPAPLGGVAHLRLGLSPTRPVPVTSAKLTFYTQERAIYDAGTSQRTYKEVIGTWETPLDVPAVLDKDLYRTVRVPIPLDIPPTFHGSKNHLESKCTVYLDIPNWPDVELETEIVVLPEVVHG